MPALRSLLAVAGRLDRRTAIAPPAAHADRYRPRAAKLRHPSFGVGEVRAWQGAGNDMKVTMRFAAASG